MKKIILGIIFMLVAVFIANSQELVKSVRSMPAGASYYSYPITAIDSVGTGLDSIVFPVQVNADMTYKFSIGVSAKKKTGVDTSFHICAYGSMFENGAKTRIGTGGARSANVTSATNTFGQFDYGTAVMYRYIWIHIEKPANLTGSSGVKINSVELKISKQ